MYQFHQRLLFLNKIESQSALDDKVSFVVIWLLWDAVAWYLDHSSENRWKQCRFDDLEWSRIFEILEVMAEPASACLLII